jgi:hypothetical protein
VKKSNGYKVQIKIGDAEVNVEGAESGVVKIVEALSDVLRGSRRPATPLGFVGTSTSIPPALGVAGASRSSSTDIRSFFEEKQPSSDIEAAAAAAYYNQYLAPEASRRDTIDSAALQEAFRLAKRPLPARTIYTLTNARNAGYLDSVGEGGQFRLNAVGYNLVEHGLGSSRREEKRKLKPRKQRHKPARKK